MHYEHVIVTSLSRPTCQVDRKSPYSQAELYDISLQDSPDPRHSFFFLRCPETLFISHENANFLISVFRMVQGEAKTPKIMGCCRAILASLPAPKIGTFRGK